MHGSEGELGWATTPSILTIEGCHSNIIGLSLPLLRVLLADLGYKVTDFWDKMLSG